MGIYEHELGNILYTRSLECGAKNLITDVPGVLVGHKALCNAHVSACTGVTAILPQARNMFRHKLPAAVHVINGFGKSIGLMQINELGVLETPILLTNTFAVGTCANALLRYMMAENPDIGVTTGTINPLVLECNDGYLNDIRAMHIREQDALEALTCAAEEFEEGAVGAGMGMSCYSLKGGIGSASRVMTLGDTRFTMGALLLTNFGILRDLTISGRKVGKDIAAGQAETDKGSAIILLATDIPLSHRQLMRIARRAQNGLARTGSITGNGSGEVVVAFSTANPIPHYVEDPFIQVSTLHEDYIDLLFRAAGECVEEAVLSSMLHAKSTVGREGHSRASLYDLLRRDNQM